jgi:hypothetical protein
MENDQKSIAFYLCRSSGVAENNLPLVYGYLLIFEYDGICVFFFINGAAGSLLDYLFNF